MCQQTHQRSDVSPSRQLDILQVTHALLVHLIAPFDDAWGVVVLTALLASLFVY